MLGNYLIFNDKQFPNPIGPTQSSNPVETEVTSEAGTDLVVRTRSKKCTWNFSFELSYARKEELKALAHAGKTKMIYQGSTYYVRVRNFQEKTVQGSEWLSKVNGLYQVSVTVKEY